MTILSTTVRGLVLAGALASASAQAATQSYGSVPNLDVKSSCNDAQKFSSDSDNKGLAYKGCMQDEMNAKDQLAKRWSSFKGPDRQTCVEQGRTPSPSYVELLTCLEMNTNVLNTGGRSDTPQIGGALAPGLSTTAPAGSSTASPGTGLPDPASK